MKKIKKIVIAPQAKKVLEELPSEHRQIIMRDFIAACQDGTLLGKSEPVDMKKLKRENPELYEEIKNSLED